MPPNPSDSRNSERDEPIVLSVHSASTGNPIEVSLQSASIICPIESAILRAQLVRRIGGGQEGSWSGTKGASAEGASKSGKRTNRQRTLDRSLLATLPANTRVILSPTSANVRLAILSFSNGLFEQVEEHYASLGFDRARLKAWLSRPSLLPRTVWAHEIIHRYIFERYALQQSNNLATRFLEQEILKELFYLFRAREEGSDRATVQRKHTPIVERAISYIEEHLYARTSVAALASAVAASQSTLLRAFRRELGAAPAAYWRQRKLDAALDLLRSGRHTVAQVSETVGYENATAFSHAFRGRFGRPPSAFRP